jgi:hypothetical protein
VKVTWEQVYAWRMRRQYLDPRGTRSASEIVGRLCGVQAQVASAAATAVAVRQHTPDGAATERDLAALSLMKTWAMRGTLHLMRPEDAGAFLSLMADTGVWRKPSWQRVCGITPQQLDALADEVAGVLDGAVLTRDQLVTRLVADRRFAGMEERLRSGWGQVLKPLAWRGVLCHGPNEGNRVTFTHPASRYPGWVKPPEPDDAAPTAIAAYLGAYGPAGPETFDRWLSLNSTSRPKLRRWFADLGDTLTEVDVEGRTGFVLSAHADELAGTDPCTGVRLLGGFDQYVLGPGTGDEVLLPKEHRSAVSRQSGWISPIVVRDGRIVGVWSRDGDELVVSPFAGAARLPREELEREAAHVARASGWSTPAVRIA